MCIAPKLCGCSVSMTSFIKNHKTLMTYFQNEGKIYFGNTDLIVNVAIVMLIFLEWSLELEVLFYYFCVFTTFFSIMICGVNENTVETEFNLDRSLITEPIFCDFF